MIFCLWNNGNIVCLLVTCCDSSPQPVIKMSAIYSAATGSLLVSILVRKERENVVRLIYWMGGIPDLLSYEHKLQEQIPQAEMS